MISATEVTQMTYNGYTETRTYNSMSQMTRIAVPGTMDMQYVYSATQNNGRITGSIDGVTGEQVTYQYDALNRLMRAETADSSWGEAYGKTGTGYETPK